jgi:hypothetical protein
VNLSDDELNRLWELYGQMQQEIEEEIEEQEEQDAD